jgi:peroxiredoxin Q/BCP
MKRALFASFALVLGCSSPASNPSPTANDPKNPAQALSTNNTNDPSQSPTLGEPPAGPPSEGDFAPSFSLKNQRGETVSLSSFLGKKPIVLYFYPKDDTPGCTIEAQDFRDRSPDLAAAGAIVLGVSLDPVESHQAFAEKYSLAFDLLADTEHSAAKRYGVLGDFNGVPIAKRVTFLIGQDGKVKKIFRDVDVSEHGEEVLEALRQL